MHSLNVLAVNSNYAFYCLATFFLSIILTRLCIRYLPSLGYIDKPGGRHIHKNAIPRGGGIAIIISFFAVLATALFIHRDIDKLKHIGLLFVMSLPLITLNMIDDRRELTSRFKLVFQLLVAGMVWFLVSPNLTLFGWHIPPFLTFVATLMWTILVINAFNLIDGLDGLASGLAMISIIGFAISFLIRGQNTFYIFEALLLFSSILGFYLFNFNPAKIFLGDTGSTFLGLLVSIAGIQVINNKSIELSSFFVPFLLVGIPIIDVVFAVWRRSVRKLLDSNASGIMEGDRDHLHHRLMRHFCGSQKIAVGILYLFDICLIVTAIIFQLYCEKQSGISVAVMVILLMIIVRQLGIIELNDSTKIVRQDWVRKRFILIGNIFHPTIDNIEILVSYLVASYLVFQSIGSGTFLLCLVLPVSLLMGIRHIHRINWIRGGIQNYVKLLATLTYGTVLGCVAGYIYLSSPRAELPPLRLYVLFSLVYYMLNLILILLERFVLHYVESFWMRDIYLKSIADGYKKVLVYGGGLQCRLLVTYLYSTMRNDIREGIIGIIDDDASLHNMTAFGFPVLGTSSDIGKIHIEHPFDKLILTVSENGSEQEERMRQFCSAHGIEMERMILSFVSCLPTDREQKSNQPPSSTTINL